MPNATVRAAARTLPEGVDRRVRKTKVAIGLLAKGGDDDPVGRLSFVASRDGKTLPLPKDGKKGRCFWHVRPTGDVVKDNLAGDRLALEYLAYQEKDKFPPLLGWMVADMPRRLDDVQVGFFTLIAIAATAGASRAREVSAYWDRCREERKSGHSAGDSPLKAVLLQERDELLKQPPSTARTEELAACDRLLAKLAHLAEARS